MSNRSRNPAMLGAEKPQNLDSFGVSDDAGDGLPACCVFGLALRAGLSHWSGCRREQFAAALRGLDFSGLFIQPKRRPGLRIYPHPLPERGRNRGRRKRSGKARGVEFRAFHGVLHTGPIPTMGESYIVTSYNSTTVRRDEML